MKQLVSLVFHLKWFYFYKHGPIKIQRQMRQTEKNKIFKDFWRKFFYSSRSFHKKQSFPLRISSVNMTKSAVSRGLGHIYWRNPQWKTSFFVQWIYRINLKLILLTQLSVTTVVMATIVLVLQQRKPIFKSFQAINSIDSDAGSKDSGTGVFLWILRNF